jgi:hypothetical protein
MSRKLDLSRGAEGLLGEGASALYDGASLARNRFFVILQRGFAHVILARRHPPLCFCISVEGGLAVCSSTEMHEFPLN